jgi:methionyl-tRNA formyltransferase
MPGAPTFDTVILLTGPAEQPALTAALRGHNPSLTVHAADTLAALEALAPLFPRARLIGFVTPVVVPARVIAALGFGAYNFHPGPPHYPGRYPSFFAIHQRAKTFGVTAHAMIERVDAGPIIGVDYFAMPAQPNLLRVDALAYARLARLFWHRARELATQAEPLPALPIAWSGRKGTRRALAALCGLPADSTTEELERHIAAFIDRPEVKTEAPGLVPTAQSACAPA